MTHPFVDNCTQPSQAYSLLNGTSVMLTYACRVHSPSSSAYNVTAAGTAFARGVPSTLTLLANNSLPETPPPSSVRRRLQQSPATSVVRRRLQQSSATGNTINNTIVALNDATSLPQITVMWYDKGDRDRFR